MKKCKNCKAPLNKSVKFCGNCGVKVKQLYVPTFIKVLIGTILVMLFCVFVFPGKMWVAQITKGFVFGYRTNDITITEMDGDIAPPTKEETEAFIAYVEGLQNYHEKWIWGNKRQSYQELNAFYYLLADCASGDITLNIDTIQSEFEEKLQEIKANNSLFQQLVSGMSITCYASECESFNKENYLATMLKDTASSLFLQGYENMSMAMASMAAALSPEDGSMASLLGNILKERGQLSTAYEMLQYAIRQDPNNEPALLTLGMLCIDLEKFEEAEACFNRMLRLSEGTGPANQGWMLLSLAEGDLKSAYLYMLEGARDGYSHIITEVYEQFKLREDYFEIAGPIFEQYALYDLVAFKRTQEIYDTTLDTIEQQVIIDRKLVLCHDAVESLVAQGINIMESKEYAEGIAKLFTNNLVGFLSTYKEEFSQAVSILEALFSGNSGGWTDFDEFFEKYPQFIPSFWPQEPEPKIYSYTWEQEVFFLNILNDYFEYKSEQIHEEYLNKAISMFETELPEGPLRDYVQEWLNYKEELEQVFGVDDLENPPDELSIEACIRGLMLMNHNFETNDHGMWDADFTRAQFNNLNKAIKDIYPLLEQGYLEQVILCEEYYLYVNNILGYISDDVIYNEYRFYQQLYVTGSLVLFPVAGSFYNGMLAMLTTCVFGKDAYFDGAIDLHIPDVPIFPVTGMGTPDGEPVIIFDYKPPKNDTLTDATEILWDEAVEKYKQEHPQTTVSEQKPTDLMINLDPANDKPAESTTEITEGLTSPTSVALKLGKLLELSVDPITGKFTVGGNLILGGAKVAFNPESGDFTLYSRVGPEVGFSGTVGNVGGSIGGAKIGFYFKTVINIDEGITSREVGADIGINALGFGAETEVGYDLATGVLRDTASKIVNSIKTTLTTETPKNEN